MSKYISIGLPIVLALLSFFTGSTTSIGDAFHKAFDKQDAIATCAQLINETPKAEVKAAIAEESVQ